MIKLSSLLCGVLLLTPIVVSASPASFNTKNVEELGTISREKATDSNINSDLTKSTNVNLARDSRVLEHVGQSNSTRAVCDASTLPKIDFLTGWNAPVERQVHYIGYSSGGLDYTSTDRSIKIVNSGNSPALLNIQEIISENVFPESTGDLPNVESTGNYRFRALTFNSRFIHLEYVPGSDLCSAAGIAVRNFQACLSLINSSGGLQPGQEFWMIMRLDRNQMRDYVNSRNNYYPGASDFEIYLGHNETFGTHAKFVKVELIPISSECSDFPVQQNYGVIWNNTLLRH